MTISRTHCFLILCCSLLVTSACATEPAVPAAVSAGGLQPCPDRPNCVSSAAADEQHRIAPLTFNIPAEKAWQLLVKQVEQLPRTKVVAQRSDYLHVECRSAVFGFVDDLEFQLLAGKGEVAVRSAARSGYYDFGVNRRRIEELRRGLLLKTSNLFLNTRKLTSSKEDHLTEFLAAHITMSEPFNVELSQLLLGEYAEQNGWDDPLIASVDTQVGLSTPTSRAQYIAPLQKLSSYDN